MSDNPAGRVLDAALSVAIAAPYKRGQHVFAAQIPWVRIDELRAALDEMGIDWRSYVKP